MKRVAILLLILVVGLAIPVLAAAQMHDRLGQHMGTGQQHIAPGQHMMGPGMRNNMGMMSGMVGEMHQMMQSGQLNPEQEQQMLKWMNQWAA